MGLIPMLFYAAVNGFALLLETVWIACGRPDVVGAYRRLRGRANPAAAEKMASEKKKAATAQ